MTDKFKEALKELGRVVVLAIIPILIDSVTAGEFSFRVLAVAAALAGLRFLDKYLHLGEVDGKAGGLTGF
jgi:hypothetical protein